MNTLLSGAPLFAFIIPLLQPLSAGSIACPSPYEGEDTLPVCVRTGHCGAGGGWCWNSVVAGTVRVTVTIISLSTDMNTIRVNLSGAPLSAYYYVSAGNIDYASEHEGEDTLPACFRTIHCGAGGG